MSEPRFLLSAWPASPKNYAPTRGREFQEPPPLPGVCNLGENGTTFVDRVVLLVDDEPLVCAVAAMMLEDLGCEVVTASDAADALEKPLTNPRIEILITASLPRCAIR
jgi:hypothetical protein